MVNILVLCKLAWVVCLYVYTTVTKIANNVILSSIISFSVLVLPLSNPFVVKSKVKFVLGLDMFLIL